MNFNSIKDIFNYKPKKYETFELLETPTEGTDNESPNQNNNSKKSKPSVVKKPSQQNGTKTQNNKDNDINSNNTEGLVSINIQENLDVIKKEFDIPSNTDIVSREFQISGKVKAFIVYVGGMVDRPYVSDFVLRQLMSKHNFDDFNINTNPEVLIDYINDNVISADETQKINDFTKILYHIVNGNTALFVDGCSQCLIISTVGFEKRDIDKPFVENIVFGSQEAFTESLRTNISLVRKIIKNQNLRTEVMPIGKTNQQSCAVMYLEGVTNKELIAEVKRRIASIDTDFIIGGGMLSQYIEDNSLMLFPQTLTTERPDRTASFIVEGKVAIITEGAPFSDIVPVTFYHLLQTSEDSTLKWQYGTFLRLIRVVGILVSSLFPALFVAVSLFHQEAIPTELLLSIAKSSEEVPFPTIVEILVLEVAFELIREGGIRVPGVIGQTLGIVGALILGQAAVQAKLVSPILIIIVAVTGLGSFTMPNYSLGLGLRIMRFFFTFLAAFLGFYGLSLGIFIIGCIACSMKSFGVPFLSPVAPKTASSPDLVLRQPIWKQQARPDVLNTQNKSRQGNPSRKWKKN